MSQFQITNVTARQVFNTLWTPSVEATVEVDGRYIGRAIAPQGQSTGSLEAREVLDGGSRFGGIGCLQAVSNVNTEIRAALLGMDATNQRAIDQTMIALDGTPNKNRLGANAIVAVSAAVAYAAAAAVGLPLYRYLNQYAHILPVPLLSTIDGGHYAFGYSSEFQEFNLFPTGADTLSEALEICREVHFALGDLLAAEYGPLARLVNSAGGYSIACPSAKKTFDYMLKAIEQCGYSGRILLGADCAASHWYDPEMDRYRFEGKLRTREEMLEFYQSLVQEYPVVSLEDPFDENDIEGFAMATNTLGIQIVGDDFFVTNPQVLKAKLPANAANALLWKYNQIGTLTEAFEAAAIATGSGYGVMASERSGESEDTILSDLVVALNAGQIKTGTLNRTERVAKYNRLLEIEAELGANAIYAGVNYQHPYLK
ncbi:MAG: phosphopyruvate hydratase [Anaerotruncus sp.]|nr:phosphopyruvate hydratase [Anaerotruncus sp.]